MVVALAVIYAAPASRQSALATVKRKRLLDIPLATVAALVYVSLYLPILLVFLLSFFSMRRGKVDWDTFSLSWYAKLFENDALGSALWNSLLVGTLASRPPRHLRPPPPSS